MQCLGIDLGTTHTVAALDGTPISFSVDPEAGGLLPSVVSFPPSGGTLIGTPAKRRRLIDAQNTVFSAKRFIGRTWDSPELGELRKRFSFNLTRAADGGLGFKTRAGVFTPVDISARLLGAVVAETGDDPEKLLTMITVPAAFRPEQRRATLAAARQVGLVNVKLLDEPCATALAYSSRIKAGIVAVYDLGGGTFDFAILDCTKKPFRILANDGHQYLGGNDIDDAIAHWAADAVHKALNWDLRSNPDLYDRLLAECELAKIRLSTMESTAIDLSQVDPVATSSPKFQQRHRWVPFDRAVLQRAAGDVMRRTFGVCENVLARFGMRPKDLDAVLLAGGGTRLPQIRAGIEHVFGQAPREEFSPLHVVAIGASMAAESYPPQSE